MDRERTGLGCCQEESNVRGKDEEEWEFGDVHCCYERRGVGTDVDGW